MKREEFMCERCGDADKTLNVHHAYYETGLMPWEYPDESLHCLCEPCHKTEQGLLVAIKQSIGVIPIESNWRILGYLWGLSAKTNPTHVFRIPYGQDEQGVTNWGVDDFCDGIADAWKMHFLDVIEASHNDGSLTGAMLQSKKDGVQQGTEA